MEIKDGEMRESRLKTPRQKAAGLLQPDANRVFRLKKISGGGVIAETRPVRPLVSGTDAGMRDSLRFVRRQHAGRTDFANPRILNQQNRTAAER